jgi:hypothetical protein
MMNFGAQKTINKKMLTFLEFPPSNTAGTLLVYIVGYIYKGVTVFFKHPHLMSSEL